MKTIFWLVTIIILLMLAALTAASETSIIAVSRLRLRRLASTGSKAAKTILKILETPERFFGTILVANNIVDTLLASIITVLMIAVVSDEKNGVVLATIVATFLIIVAEVAAKTLAARHSEKLSLLLVRPIKVFILILSPMVKVLAVITNAIVNLMSGPAAGKQALVTDEDIRALIKLGEEDNAPHRDKYRMLSKVFDFGETVVRSVMTPKKEMVSIDVNSKFDDIVDDVLESGYSRIPVYRDKPENIIGIINMKDLLSLSANKELVVLQDIVYPVTFVPDTKKVTELLKEFQKGHTHIALVTDPQGKVAGLITLEDVLEEIVGEIQDEYDIRNPA
ncbi:MAG: hemolysin family protein [Candidatus Omnitrophota bacterium]